MNSQVVLELPPKRRITAICASPDALYIGDDTGLVSLYRVRQYEDPVSRQSMRYMADFSVEARLSSKSRVVENLSIHPQFNLVIALCDGVLRILDGNTLDVVSALDDLKGCSAHAVNHDSSARDFLCCVHKKTVYILKYEDKQVVKFQTFPAPDSLIGVCYSGTIICMASKRQYFVMNLVTGECDPMDFFDRDRAQPLIVNISKTDFLFRAGYWGCQVFHVKNNLHYDPVHDGIPWTADVCPGSILYCIPYVVGVSEKQLLLHSLYEGESKPSVELKPNQTILAACAQQRSSCDEKAAADLGAMFVATQNEILILTSVTLDEQIANLIAESKVQPALDLLDRYVNITDEERKRKARRIHEHAGMTFFRNMDFEEAFRQWGAARTNIVSIVYLFMSAARHPFLLQYQKIAEGASWGEMSIENIGAGEDVNMVVTTFLIARKKGEGKRHTEGQVEVYLQKARQSFFDFLVSERKKAVKSGNASKESSRAVEELQVLDYTLITLSLEQNNMEVLLNILSSENWCPLQECEASLRQGGCFHALALLYRARNQSLKAIDIWHRILTGTLKDGRCAKKEIVDYLVELLFKVDDMDVLWKYTPAILEESTSKGLQVFIRPVERPPLPANRVLRLLENYSSQITQDYLEHLVLTNKIEDSVYHTRLALLYADAILSFYEFETREDDALVVNAGEEAGLVGEWRKKLLLLLRTSTHYDVQRVLSRLGKSPLYEELVVLYSKISAHHEALRILVYKLCDYQLAESYCLERSVTTVSTSVTGETVSTKSYPLLFKLVETSLQPSAREKPRIKEVLRLLEKHSGCPDVNVCKVLHLFPDDVPLRSILPYVQRELRSSTHSRRSKQIERHVNRTRHLDVHVELIHLRSKSGLVEPDTKCVLCGKKLGGSLVAIYPNLAIIHYSCHERQPR